MNRQARLFALVEYLRGRRTGVTAESLADRFGTTVRTIYRDLETLKVASLPLVAERGRGGGYSLDKSYALPPVNFTAREAAVLLTVGRWAAQMRWMPFEEVLQSGLDKVRGALTTTAQRELVEHMAGMKFIGVPAHAAQPGVRAAVEHAWFERRPLRVRYRNKDGAVSERTIEIESVVFDRQYTYLNASSQTDDAHRAMRLDRIEAAAVVPIASDEKAPRPTPEPSSSGP